MMKTVKDEELELLEKFKQPNPLIRKGKIVIEAGPEALEAIRWIIWELEPMMYYISWGPLSPCEGGFEMEVTIYPQGDWFLDLMVLNLKGVKGVTRVDLDLS